MIQTRLFFRIIAKGKEVYFLKAISLSIAFACATLILLFARNEFGYDRFHQEYKSIFRLLQRNNRETYIGTRFSNKIPADVFEQLRQVTADSLVISRVKRLDLVNTQVGSRSFGETGWYAADPEIEQVFTFEQVSGSLSDFNKHEPVIMLSTSAAQEYFGSDDCIGKEVMIHTIGDTLSVRVAAVFRDFPTNAHESFDRFIRLDSGVIEKLFFNPEETGVYGRLRKSNEEQVVQVANRIASSREESYHLQPISDIYFGPRVGGEDARHGDAYSIFILVSVTTLILFLSVTNYVNLTTLTLPYRSKELAIRKLAGTSQFNMVSMFFLESAFLVGISVITGVVLLLIASPWVKGVLAIDLQSMLLRGDSTLLLILAALFLAVTAAPLFLTLRFIRATPNRLLSTETITFPRFKKTIMFLQLGISIFLIVASLVLGRQINYSLLKEPGRNYDQVVYVDYPSDLTSEGLASMRLVWKKINPNFVDLMATSQLPDRISSKELNSEFYSLAVDRGFREFFELAMLEGDWFKANTGDSIVVVNERGKALLNGQQQNVAGVFRDISGQFNHPQRPIKMNLSSHFDYHYLCIRILEVDIRRTVKFLERHFEQNGQKAEVKFLNKRFEEWLGYQDKLNSLSALLAILSAVLSCFAIYGLSISIVRDKLKQIAIRKLCGASNSAIVKILVREFVNQMLLAVIVFGPLTYIVLREMLRNFVFITQFHWSDPVVPLGYCMVVIVLLSVFQTMSLQREDLSSALKG